MSKEHDIYQRHKILAGQSLRGVLRSPKKEGHN